jgi:hypothetical protein
MRCRFRKAVAHRSGSGVVGDRAEAVLQEREQVAQLEGGVPQPQFGLDGREDARSGGQELAIE